MVKSDPLLSTTVYYISWNCFHFNGFPANLFKIIFAKTIFITTAYAVF